MPGPKAAVEEVFGRGQVQDLRRRFAKALIAGAHLATTHKAEIEDDLTIFVLSPSTLELHFPFLGLEQTAHWDGTWQDVVDLVLGQVEDWAHDIQAEYERFGPTEWHSQD